MTRQDSLPAHPTAEWISRYAAGLLSSTPGLKPLDAVRLAMDASAGEPTAGTRLRSQPTAQPRAIQR
jgi:hypothetical protein